MCILCDFLSKLSQNGKNLKKTGHRRHRPIAVPNGRVCADGVTVGTAGLARVFFAVSNFFCFRAVRFWENLGYCTDGFTVGKA
jgi:hypothetical protein